SSNGGGTSTGGPIVTEDGKVTRDTLVSFIRHYGKLNVRNITLRQEIDINDTSKIKKLLGDYYPLWLDKHLNRILKVPYEATVTIGFDLGEIALSVKETGENKFSVSKPTPIVDITNLIIRFDQEYRDIGTLRSDIETGEFNAAWQEKNVPERIKSEISKERKDVFIDAVLNENINNILSSVKKRYQGIDLNFESAEREPVFSEIPKPIIEKKDE
ncbi:MAG: hypothetical protein IJ150_10360, partial [Bacteroidales bacterium]|nr:hypothetical protein [Bacteroidales bacterium]